MNGRNPDQEAAASLIRRLQRLKPAHIDLSLDRVSRLLDRLGNPQAALPPVVHVAGTNGKGSTLAVVRALLEAGGQTVHAYTSPHLCRFNERVVVAGTMIADSVLADVLDTVLAADTRGDITFFEATTAAALLAFSRTPADVTLLETGLGGRLDATNVIEQPAVTAITPIGFDHTAFLGNTLAAIAGEKAGILKRDRPVIIGPQPAEALRVLEERAASMQAPTFVHGIDWSVLPSATPEEPAILRATGVVDRLLASPVALPGAHQCLNAAMAVLIADRLQDAPIAPATIAAGVGAAVWPGRLQRLAPGPVTRSLPDVEIWIDAAHNPDGGRVLGGFLDTLPPAATALAFGMYQGKNAADFLDNFRGRVTGVIAMAVDGEQPAQPASTIADAARAAGFKTSIANTPDALPAAIAPGVRRLIIAGSLALIGRILAANEQCP